MPKSMFSERDSWSCHPVVINVLKIYRCPSESTAENLRRKSVVMYRKRVNQRSASKRDGGINN